MVTMWMTNTPFRYLGASSCPTEVMSIEYGSDGGAVKQQLICQTLQLSRPLAVSDTHTYVRYIYFNYACVQVLSYGRYTSNSCTGRIANVHIIAGSAGLKRGAYKNQNNQIDTKCHGNRIIRHNITSQIQLPRHTSPWRVWDLSHSVQIPETPIG